MPILPYPTTKTFHCVIYRYSYKCHSSPSLGMGTGPVLLVSRVNRNLCVKFVGSALEGKMLSKSTWGCTRERNRTLASTAAIGLLIRVPWINIFDGDIQLKIKNDVYIRDNLHVICERSNKCWYMLDTVLVKKIYFILYNPDLSSVCLFGIDIFITQNTPSKKKNEKCNLYIL